MNIMKIIIILKSLKRMNHQSFCNLKFVANSPLSFSRNDTISNAKLAT